MGTGFFLYPPIKVGDAPCSVICCDLDGDGDVDIVSANMQSDDISVLLNETND